MRIVVVSDIHANLAALEAVLEAVGDRYDEVWCLGDTVGYGPRPNECCALVRERCSVVLAGNHDRVAVGTESVQPFSEDAARAIRWTREVLRPENEAWLRTLEPSAIVGRVGLFHGSPRDPVWEYVHDAGVAGLVLAESPHDVVLVGHTHAAIAARLLDGQVVGGPAARGLEVELDGGRRSLLNPGSVGQPRDGDSRAAFLVLDLVGDEPVAAEFRRADYDVAQTQTQMREAGLPEYLADRLSFGM